MTGTVSFRWIPESHLNDAHWSYVGSHPIGNQSSHQEMSGGALEQKPSAQRGCCPLRSLVAWGPAYVAIETPVPTPSRPLVSLSLSSLPSCFPSLCPDVLHYDTAASRPSSPQNHGLPARGH